MDRKLIAEVEKILEAASIASVRSWLRARGKRLSARTRDKMVERVARFIEKTEITFAELEEAIVGVEEAGGKLITLHQFREDCSSTAVKSRLAKMDIPIASKRSLGKPNGSKPTPAYGLLDGEVLRIKWSEIHQKPKMDFDEDSVVYEDVKKVIVLTADLKSKQVEIRYDRPEVFHPHSTSARSKDAYFDYFRGVTENILGAKLLRSDLQGALKKLIEMSPSLVRLHRGGHTNKRNNYFTAIVRESGKDIRDDDEYKAMYSKGGSGWAYEDHSFYWRPDQSRGKLNREVFSHVNTVDSSIRVDADCWDAEVDYAIRQIRELQ